ncbi:hypothetical protein K443DRAFT_97802 [Laccaria amethystina LaAM-08-1]|uniref:Uncharacterized protein n=1 Tax=Laccaria amethystina LaAM-08-1 TaxID=1095629 RepID=A0A0C9Y1C9_9AGAR|nr:hypothetical protein K443DRAFT_97802 [Laccaria amethystina LaAM-08-1]
MGKSAKLHKRVKKTASSSIGGTAPSAQGHAQTAKKRATLKEKGKRPSQRQDGPVLGGADYVSLMMGGRRKASEEARKLPQNTS